MRPIDADELKRLIKSGDDLIFDSMTENQLCRMIDYQDTVESEHSKGKWEMCRGFGEYSFFKCSACKKWNNAVTAFCPRCGAKMERL